MFPVKRYLGDEEHLENGDGKERKKLQVLLSKIKHRTELQETQLIKKENEENNLLRPSTFHSINLVQNVDKNKISSEAYYSDSENNIEGDNDPTMTLLADVEKLIVGEEDNNDGGVTHFSVIGDIKFKKKIKVKRVLPDWLANPSVVSVNLKRLDVSVDDIPEVHSIFRNTLKKNNITHFFPVQAQVIPWLLRTASRTPLLPAGDICVSAPTGSGKTLSYALPILQALMGQRVAQIQALVVLPVQDLASQVCTVLKTYSANTGLRVHLSSGSLLLAEDRAHLLKHRMCVGWESLADILVVTPGRLVEHLYTTPGFTLKHLRYIVIDEADRVIDSQQNNWLHHLDQHLSTENNQLLTIQSLRTAPRRPQKLLFSATLSSDPEKLNHLHLFQPRLFTSVVETTKSQGEFVGQLTTPAELQQCMVRCILAIKPLVLFHLVTRPGWSRVLVFVSSSRSGHQLTALLTLLSQRTQHTLNIAEISAECSPRHRESLLANFTSGKIDMLISTDQLARGMDITDVQYVVSYDMPKYVNAYIHRVGRTGRAGHDGMAVTLVTHSQVTMFHQMLQNTGILENISELNIEDQDLKALEEPFRECLQKLKNANEEEEMKNANRMKSARRGYSIQNTSKRKGKDIPRFVKKLK